MTPHTVTIDSVCRRLGPTWPLFRGTFHQHVGLTHTLAPREYETDAGENDADGADRETSEERLRCRGYDHRFGGALAETVAEDDEPGSRRCVAMTPEAVTLWTHIAAGVVALLTGVAAIVTTKGGARHRSAGRLYVIAMGVVVGTVVPLVAFDPTPSRIFLGLVAVFSGYFAFTGYRVLSRKRPTDGAALVDWGAALLVVGACLFLGGWGVGFLLGGESFGLVMVVFAAIGLSVGGFDLLAFVDPDRRDPWLLDHLGRMMGAYIATVTAVSVTTLTMLPPVVGWLWPTAVGVPLIWYWFRTYGNAGPLASRATDQ